MLGSWCCIDFLLFLLGLGLGLGLLYCTVLLYYAVRAC